MTNEEKAEEYANEKHCSKCPFIPCCRKSATEDRCEAYRESYADYLAGIKAGKPKWHDLRKNPDDLPKEDCTEVMFVTEYKSETLTGTYKNGGGEGTPIFDTFGIAFYEVEQVIAWCELPKFEEE